MKRQTIKPEDAPEFLLKLTSMLDCQEAQHFSKMRKSALDELSVAALKAKRKTAQEEDEARPRARGVKRDLEKDEGAASSSRAKAPRTEADDREEQMRRLNVKAPPEFVKFFPLVSHCYFKWAPKNYRVTVEFVQKDRFLNNNSEIMQNIF